MFNESKYTKWYQSIVTNAKSRPTVKAIGFELHHIIPKSLGGSNDDTNIVSLTTKEHFICHLLLTKMVDDPVNRSAMLFAIFCMTNGNGRQERYQSRLHARLREKVSEDRSQRYTGDGNPFYGKTHKESSKLYGDANPAKRPEVREKLRLKQLGVKPHNYYNGWDDETKQKIAKSMTGKKHSDAAKQKVKDTRWVVSSDGVAIKVHVSELDMYIANGFKRGRKWHD